MSSINHTPDRIYDTENKVVYYNSETMKEKEEEEDKDFSFGNSLQKVVVNGDTTHIIY